jgi:hypothetical protein
LICGLTPGFVAPIILTLIGKDGAGRSAKIEIEQARGALQ